MNRILPADHMLMTEPSLDLISFPSAIDNTIRSTFVACPMKFFYSHLNRLSPAGTNVHLHAGGAFAAGMEAARFAFYRDGKSVDDSIAAGVAGLITYYGDYECPEDSAKSLTRMAGALEYYFSVHPLDSDYVTPHKTAAGDLGIEFSFTIPLPFEHPETGDPLVYTGRFDMLGRHKNGSLFVVDEKTSTSLGAQWSRNWDLDSQFTGYCWGAHHYGLPVIGALIRGISILKTKYDNADCIIYRPEWQINRWYDQLLLDVQDMLDIYAGLKKPRMVLDKGTCNNYGGCAYSRLCGSEHPANWLDPYYSINTWDPLRREKQVEV